MKDLYSQLVLTSIKLQVSFCSHNTTSCSFNQLNLLIFNRQVVDQLSSAKTINYYFLSMHFPCNIINFTNTLNKSPHKCALLFIVNTNCRPWRLHAIIKVSITVWPQCAQSIIQIQTLSLWSFSRHKLLVTALTDSNPCSYTEESFPEESVWDSVSKNHNQITL